MPALAELFAERVSLADGGHADVLLDEPVRKAEPDDTHALIVSAMLQVAEDAADTGDDPADALKALAGLSQDPDRLRDVLAGGTLQKAWDESLHPRDHGKFSSKPGAAGRSDGSGLDDSGNDLTDRPRSRSQAEAAAGVIRDILMGECGGDTKDWCVTTAEAVRAAFPDAEVWDGNYDGDGDQAHTIFKLGDWFVDVTADQFGGPDVFVARELPEDTYPDFAPTEAGRPAEVGRRMAAAMRAKFARRLEKAWDESLHPRDDSGRFIGKDKLQAAKTDPALAKQLRDKTTDPGERAKLDRVLSGEADPGRTKRGEQRHQAAQKRQATESDRRRAHQIAMRAFSGGLGYDDFEELADLLPSLTVEQLRAVRSAVGASWGGQRLKRQGMVDTLVAFARGRSAPVEQDAPGSPEWQARMMNREPQPKPGVDAWESAKVDDAADRAERMGAWESDRPESEAAGVVAGAARADLAGAKEWAGDVAVTTPKPAAEVEPQAPPEGMPAAPGPSPLNTASPYSLAARDGDRRGHLGRVLAAAGALAPQDALDYATADGDRRVTAAQAEIILSNRLGLGTAAAARAVLATLKPVGTTVVGGGRKRPTYDVLDLFRAVGKLAEPVAGNNPESGHTPSPPVNSPVAGQSGPDTGGEPNGRGQRLSDEVRGGAGGRGGAGVGAGDGPSPGDAPRPPGGSPTGEPAPAGGRPGNRGAGGGPGGGRPGGVAAGGAGAGGGPGGRGPAGGTVPPADGPGGGGGPGRADGGGEVALPALTAPTAYGPQAVVTRGGLVVRDGTGGQKTPPSPAPESLPSSLDNGGPDGKVHLTPTEPAKGGGGAASGGKPMIAELPKLTGSDRQVEWAERVRAEALDPAGYSHVTYRAPESREVARRVIEASLPLVPAEYAGKASWWIDNRKKISPKLLNTYAFQLWGNAGGLVWDHVVLPRLARQAAARLRPADRSSSSADSGDDLTPTETADLVEYAGGAEKAERIAAAYGWRLSPTGGKPMRDTITAADLPPAGTFIDAATDQIGGRRVAKIRRWLENPKASESGVAGVLVEATPTSGVYGKPGYDVRATPYRAGGERLTSRTQYAHKTPTGVLDTQVTAEQAAEGFNRLASDLSEKLGLTAGDDAAFGRIFGGAK